jgi:hypothetical protein
MNSDAYYEWVAEYLRAAPGSAIERIARWHMGVLRGQIVDTQAKTVYDPTNHIQKGRALLEAAPTTSQRMEVR